MIKSLQNLTIDFEELSNKNDTIFQVDLKEILEIICQIKTVSLNLTAITDINGLSIF